MSYTIGKQLPDPGLTNSGLGRYLGSINSSYGQVYVWDSTEPDTFCIWCYANKARIVYRTAENIPAFGSWYAVVNELRGYRTREESAREAAAMVEVE